MDSTSNSMIFIDWWLDLILLPQYSSPRTYSRLSVHLIWYPYSTQSTLPRLPRHAAKPMAFLPFYQEARRDIHLRSPERAGQSPGNSAAWLNTSRSAGRLNSGLPLFTQSQRKDRTSLSTIPFLRSLYVFEKMGVSVPLQQISENKRHLTIVMSFLALQTHWARPAEGKIHTIPVISLSRYWALSIIPIRHHNRQRNLSKYSQRKFFKWLLINHKPFR